MEEYRQFKALARKMLARFNVNIDTFYGCRETALAPLEDRYYIHVNGQGLPAKGFTVGRATAADAVATMAQQVKSHKHAADEARMARDRARRAPDTETPTA